MKQIKFLAFFLIILILNSCVLNYYVKHKEYDDLTNPFSTDTMIFHRDILFQIGLEKTTTQNRKYYSVTIIYAGSGWLFMDGYVKIKADEKLITVNDSKPHRMVLSGGNVQETIRATISKENIELMKNAKILKIQFHGKPIEITEKGISFISQFYNEQM